MRRLASILLIVIAMSATGASSQPVEQLDWCAPVIVRPESRFYTFTPPCEPWWPDDEIARRADFIFGGFLRPTTSTLPPDQSTCFGPSTMENSKAYSDRLRARAATYGRTLHFIYYARFDLVDRQTATTPGFDPDYLVDARKRWREATDFFNRDTSPACVCGCEWTADVVPGSSAVRLRDIVDAAGGPGTYETKISYASPLGSGGTLAGAPRQFAGLAAIADQTNPAYRAWRIEHIRDAMTEGGFDVVELNHKFHHFVPSDPPPWWGGSGAPNVSAYLAADTTPWSAQPIAYGYREYLAGWAALADDLDAAGIPYAVNTTPFPWRPGSIYDDPATTDVDESAILRGVVERARFVFMQRFAQVPQAEFDATVAQIQAAGIATVVPFDAGCGNGSPPGRPPTQLSAGLTVVPDAAVTATFTGTSIRVSVSGVASGAWDADFWCQCAATPCGAPDASITGQLGTSWQLPASLCDTAYQNGVGRRTPRAEVRRAGYTSSSTRAITVCAPACSNGRDDDRDGALDFPLDPGCASATDPTETAPELTCDDNIDNEGDTHIDFPADLQCVNAAGSEGPRAGGCGLGAELALVLPWLSRRRRARRVAV